MIDKRKVPEIRFKGFDGEWEESKLGVMVSFSKGRGYSKSDITDVGTPIILYGRMYTNYQTVISEVNSYTTPKLNSVFSKGNEVIIPSSGESAEDIARASVVGNSNILIGGDLNVLLPTTDVDSVFLAYNISNGNPKKELEKRAQGKTVVHLHNSDLQELLISYPKILEQSQIGTFFKNLDSLITLHQRKYDKLTTVKKAMLEKMFPKEGADVPEIRFKGFTEKWERRTLGEIVTEIRRPIELRDEREYELVTVKRRNEGVVSRGKLKGKDILVKTYFELRSGDYIISKRQIVHGANGIVPQSLDKAIVSNEYLVAVGNERITTDFFALFSKLPHMYKKFFLSSYGIDIEKLVFDVDDWKKRYVVIPLLSEQQRISSFFQNLDSLITLQQRELDKLKNIKKACLERMFV
jgi:type I restriction enzyme S subunit